MLYSGSEDVPPKVSLSLWASGPPLNAWFLAPPPRAHIANGTSIGSSVFVGLMDVTSGTSVTIGRVLCFAVELKFNDILTKY